MINIFNHHKININNIINTNQDIGAVIDEDIDQIIKCR